MVIPYYFVRAIYCHYNIDSNIVTMSYMPFYNGHLGERRGVGRKTLRWTFTHDRAPFHLVSVSSYLARRLARSGRSIG